MIHLKTKKGLYNVVLNCGEEEHLNFLVTILPFSWVYSTFDFILKGLFYVN